MADSPAALRDLLIATTRTLRRRWHQTLEPWQLSPHEHRALRVLGDAGRTRECGDARGPLRLGEIAKALRIVPRSATEVIDRLEARGLTERLPDPADRRAVCVQLTDAGHDLARQLDAARDAEAGEFFALLDDRDRADLARILRKLVGP
ncbi:MarR family winged helix-turn-helix transcriptional regulator [Rhodococcus zopfii]|uniref:MarR family transcriptional regulator n=1 Tax=Rhodococcus zopfii TaxID=43772 RepID=A0ABU3WS97_9NOCA|nr:MarR family transcriptional regulator [Rhodococcus zopfii]MDV2476880.1 MarR family transcriptional regulator [Rhodococcus zopfii]